MNYNFIQWLGKYIVYESFFFICMSYFASLYALFSCLLAFFSISLTELNGSGKSMNPWPHWPLFSWLCLIFSWCYYWFLLDILIEETDFVIYNLKKVISEYSAWSSNFLYVSTEGHMFLFYSLLIWQNTVTDFFWC